VKKIINLLVIAILSTSCSKEILQHKLTVDAIPSNGGSVTPPSNSYENGQSVNLLATPAGEYVFKEWKGDLTGTLNPSTIIIDKDKQASGVFEKRQYPLNLTIEGNGTVKEEIIAVASQSQYPSGTTVRLTPQPLEGWEFSGWSGDIKSNDNPLTITIKNAVNLKASFVEKKILSIQIENSIDSIYVSQKFKLKILGIFEDGSKTDLSNSVQITYENKLINPLPDNFFVGVKTGIEKIKIIHKNKIINTSLKVTSFEDVKIIDEKLNSTALNTKLRVPVIIINYIPTNDGINLDNSRAPGVFRLPNKTIVDVKLALNTLSSGIKFSAEEGSKFRGYNSKTASSYVGIDVVKQFNFYEIPLQKAFFKSQQEYLTDPMNEPDYTKIFEMINLKYLVEIMGVKEIWFNVSHFHKGLTTFDPKIHKPENFVVLPESNMSSPTTGDISNSFRQNNDLPIFKNTYVVYGFNYNGAFDVIDFIPNNIHLRSHQIEVQISYLDRSPEKELWYNKFVGIPKSGGNPTGRCGNVHFPPNAVNDYDYNNLTYVNSDIEDWKPDGTGLFKKINKNTWNNYYFNWPQNVFNDSQSNWLLYWYQSIPGQYNGLEYNGKKLVNWWDLFYNWDDSIKNKKTLWVE